MDVRERIAALNREFSAPGCKKPISEYNARLSELEAEERQEKVFAAAQKARPTIDGRVPKPAPEVSLENDPTPVTRKFFMGVMKSVLKDVADTFRSEDAKLLEKLEARITAIENRPTMQYRGVWEADGRYQPGDVVTDSGSMWHANCSTTARPGASSDWTLCVKHGRDLR